MSLYNQNKPHIELKRKSPIEFENMYLCIDQKTNSKILASEASPQFQSIYNLTDFGQKTSDSKITIECNLNISET